MPVMHRLSWLAAAGLLLCGQNTWADNARLSLYVFNEGAPDQDIEVLVDQKLVTLTDRQGRADISLEPGIHILELRLQDAVVLQQQLLATQDEVSQWIVDVSGRGSAIFEVESSSPQAGASSLASNDGTDDNSAIGTLTGQLINADGGDPVAGARIFVNGMADDIRSDDQGRFEISVAAGRRSVSILHTGFNTLTRDGIEVGANETVALELQLTPAGSELPEYVVLVPHISGSLAAVMEERRDNVGVANILGAEQISKAGDSDAASALKRVTGLTLVGGRFIYVRGLGERYSSTLLNGANLPSPDPVRRVVPLDLFPSGIIDSIAVNKAFTPDLPAEFGGGTVLLRTRSIPEEGFLQAGFSMGVRQGTTGKDGLRYDGGGSDWTGFDDGTRDMPELLANAIADGVQLREFNRFTGEGFTQQELEAIGESLPVNYQVEPRKIGPDLGFSLTGGNRFEIGNHTLGFLAALDYDNKWQTTEQQRTDYIVSGGVLESENDYHYNITEREIGLSGFFTLGAELGEHSKLAYNSMLLRNTTDTTQRQQGFNKDAEGGDVQFTELEWIERELFSNQFTGEHVIGALWDLSLNWDYTTATARQDEPDTRLYRYDPDTLTATTDDLILSLRNDGNQRRWGELEDNSDSWNVNLVQALNFFSDTEISINGGLGSVRKDRDSGVRRFAFQSKGPLSGNLDLRRNLNPEFIIFADTIDPSGWQLAESTIATDAYTAEQSIDARWIGADIFYHDWLRLAGGIRTETSDQSVTTFDIFDPQRNPVASELSTDDRFAAANLTLIFGDHQIRAGYGETINRPDFKELSPSLFKDPILDRQVIGNPDLEPAFLTHYDLRWDYYFSPGNFVSLGLFYKEFENPIETVILAGAAQITTFNNAEGAENLGAELELYTDLGFIGEWWGERDSWEKFYINTNYAWIDSEINLSADNAAVQTSSSRPLQGQSPFVWNFQLGYDDLDRGINAALLFNLFGERIVDVGTNGAPDIYEQPRPQLDFVYAHRLNPHWKIKFKASNLLDPDVEITQGPETRIHYTTGREFKLSVEWNK